MATVTLITEKRQLHPPGWSLLRQEQVSAQISNKRVYCRNKVFDRQTGQEITSDHRSWYKHTVKL